MNIHHSHSYNNINNNSNDDVASHKNEKAINPKKVKEHDHLRNGSLNIFNNVCAFRGPSPCIELSLLSFTSMSFSNVPKFTINCIASVLFTLRIVVNELII